MTRLLDTLFVLARMTISAIDPRTYIPAYDYLQKGSTVLNAVPPPTPDGSDPDEIIDTANYMRCISGAWHNLSGVLYQAGRHGAAVGFLKDGCEIGVKALALREPSPAKPNNPDSETPSKEQIRAEEGWKQLEEGLFRRWELLAVCHSKIGDRKVSGGVTSSDVGADVSAYEFRARTTHLWKALKRFHMRLLGLSNMRQIVLWRHSSRCRAGRSNWRLFSTA